MSFNAAGFKRSAPIEVGEYEPTGPENFRISRRSPTGTKYYSVADESPMRGDEVQFSPSGKWPTGRTYPSILVPSPEIWGRIIDALANGERVVVELKDDRYLKWRTSGYARPVVTENQVSDASDLE